MRHLVTSNQGIPISMLANENSNSSNSSLASQSGTNYQQHILNSDSNSGGTIISQNSGQYILVQRSGVISNENSSLPRASSAPPSQNQVIQNKIEKKNNKQISIIFHSISETDSKQWHT